MKETRKNNISELGSKVPPHSNDAEVSVLGSIMLQSSIMQELIEIITPDSFYSEIHKTIYESILDLYNEGIHCPRKILIKSNAHLLSQNNPHWLDNINTPQEYEQFRNNIS